MSFKILNPNHRVTQQMDEDGFMYKVVAALCAKAGGKLTITEADIIRLATMFGDETPTLATKAFDDRLEFVLIPESEGVQLARKEGGMPV